MLSSKNIEKLHIIRGLTALYVVIYHAKFILWCGGNDYIKTFPRSNWNLMDYFLFIIDMLSSAGFEMVLVFFVLSGFFIAYSFDKNNWQTLSFYSNRISRIYPPYIGSILFSLLILKIIYFINPGIFSVDLPFERNQRLAIANSTDSIVTFLYSIIFLPNKEYMGMNSVYWSLLYEGIFYLLAPLVILRPNLYFLVSICTYMLIPESVYTPITFLSKYSLFFATGILIFQFVKNSPIQKHKWEIPILILITLASLSLVIGFGALKMKTFSSIATLLLSTSSILLLTRHEFNTNALSRLCVKLGEISYSLYLFHLPVLLFIYSILSLIFGTYNFYQRIYWVSIPFAIIISYLFYFLIEKKSLNFISNKKLAKSHAVHKS